MGTSLILRHNDGTILTLETGQDMIFDNAMDYIEIILFQHPDPMLINLSNHNVSFTLAAVITRSQTNTSVKPTLKVCANKELSSPDMKAPPPVTTSSC